MIQCYVYVVVYSCSTAAVQHYIDPALHRSTYPYVDCCLVKRANMIEYVWIWTANWVGESFWEAKWNETLRPSLTNLARVWMCKSLANPIVWSIDTGNRPVGWLNWGSRRGWGVEAVTFGVIHGSGFYIWGGSIVMGVTPKTLDGLFH